jgi:hypothetical protein
VKQKKGVWRDGIDQGKCSSQLRLLPAKPIANIIFTGFFVADRAGVTARPFQRFGRASVQYSAGIFSTLNLYLLLFAGGLSLFLISSNLRSRSLKMVFTKPCTPSSWLVSTFLSAVAVSFLLNCAVLASMVVMSLFWHVPIRAGLVFISADTFIASVGIIAYMTLLASVMHPAIAVTFALIFNASTFYSLQFWTQSVMRAGNSSVGLRVLEKTFHYLYILLPMVHAFEKKTEGIYSSLRVMHGEWKYLLYAFGYVLVLSSFCYLAALSALQRKRYI